MNSTWNKSKNLGTSRVLVQAKEKSSGGFGSVLFLAFPDKENKEPVRFSDSLSAPHLALYTKIDSRDAAGWKNLFKQYFKKNREGFKNKL